MSTCRDSYLNTWMCLTALILNEIYILNMKKTQTKIEVRSILRPSQINRLQSQRTVGSSESGSETISVEKYLRDFKS